MNFSARVSALGKLSCFYALLVIATKLTCKYERICIFYDADFHFAKKCTALEIYIFIFRLVAMARAKVLQSAFSNLNSEGGGGGAILCSFLILLPASLFCKRTCSSRLSRIYVHAAAAGSLDDNSKRSLFGI
jgi:hypothetical protein